MRALRVGRPAIREAHAEPAAHGPAGDPSRPPRPRGGAIDRPDGGRDRRERCGTSFCEFAGQPRALKEARSSLRWRWRGFAARKRSASDIVRLRAGFQAQGRRERPRKVRRPRRRVPSRDRRDKRQPDLSGAEEAMFKWLAASYRGAVSVPGLEKLTLQEHGSDSRRNRVRQSGGRREAHGGPFEPRQRALPHRAYPDRELMRGLRRGIAQAPYSTPAPPSGLMHPPIWYNQL